MAKFEVKNSEGKKVAEAELAAEVYGIEPNIHVMHHIVKCQMASWRQGTQSAKGRSEVSGGGKKPWRQKGTGRARQGSIRAAQWRHGGVVFAPSPVPTLAYDTRGQAGYALRAVRQAGRWRARARRRLRLREAFHQGCRRHAQGSRP